MKPLIVFFIINNIESKILVLKSNLDLWYRYEIIRVVRRRVDQIVSIIKCSLDLIDKFLAVQF